MPDKTKANTSVSFGLANLTINIFARNEGVEARKIHLSLRTRQNTYTKILKCTECAW